MLIEALCPLHIRRAMGDLHLRPGIPVDLSDEEAVKLLQKVPDKVREVQPAINADGFPLNPVYWEREDGAIDGPGQPEFISEVGLIVAYGSNVVTVSDETLRSKKAFESQPKFKE